MNDPPQAPSAEPAEVAALPAEQALERIMAAPPDRTEMLGRAWFAARSPVRGVAEMLELARSGPASRRHAVLVILDDVLEDGVGSLDSVLAYEPLLGPAAQAFLSARRPGS